MIKSSSFQKKNKGFIVLTGNFFWKTGKNCRFILVLHSRNRQDLRFKAENRLGMAFASKFIKKGGSR
ncbi:hypothetical protein B8W99_12095 [Peribacillus simplex]|nr:hypothetical protein CHI08_23790 [Peribacillus simplex]PAL12252.1 hypothetical protein B8W99_12095 [Peribacillus simplex]